MIDPDVVLAAIDALPPMQDEGERGYLGASIIGEPCARKLWLQFHRYAEAEQFEPRMLRLFFRGQREEGMFEMYLRETGFNVIHDCMQQARWKHGFFSGAPDGVLEKDGVRYLPEYKTINDSGFKALERGRIESLKPLHFAQIQVNGDEYKCDYGLYLVVNKNTDELFCDIIPIDTKKAQEYRNKSEYITMADKPPERIATKPTDYRCKTCHVRDQCWGYVKPRVSCRNCTSATKHPEQGTFGCEIVQKSNDVSARSSNNQLDERGWCERHSFNPYAMQELYQWQPMEFYPDRRAVHYKKPDGSEVINGFDAVQSKDLEI
jgi:hypothetical protein